MIGQQSKVVRRNMEKLHEDINTVCLSLEGLGCDSVVLIASQAGYAQFGSRKGRQFLEENFVIVTDFIQYCRDGPQELEVPTTDLIGNDLSVSSKQKTASLVVKMRVHGDKLVPIAEQPVLADSIPSLTDPFKYASQTKANIIGDTTTGMESDTMMSDRYDSYDDDLEMDMPESTDKQKMKETADEEVQSENTFTEEQSIEVKIENVDPDAYDTDLINNFADVVGASDQLLKRQKRRSKMSSLLHSSVVDKTARQSKKNRNAEPPRRSGRRQPGIDKTKDPGKADETRNGDLSNDLNQDVSELKADVKREPTSDATDKNYKCDSCNKTYKSLPRLQSHIKLHTENRSYTCKLCPATFPREYKLRNHEKVHSDERPFKCDVCFKGFKNWHNMKKHKRLHDPDKGFMCDKCGKQFAMSQYLEEHKRIHTGVRPFVCVKCNIGFRTSSHFSKHRRFGNCISSDRTDAINRTSGALKSKAKHTVAKDASKDTGVVELESKTTYKCDVCFKDFKYRSNLNKHKRLHNPDKRFVCDTCGKKFAVAQYLEEHKRVHTGVKPYVCVKCSNGFRTSSQLSKHKQSGDCAATDALKPIAEHERDDTDAKYASIDIGVIELESMTTLPKESESILSQTETATSLLQMNVSATLSKTDGPSSQNNTYHCSVCNKSFKNKSTLKAHANLHSSKPSFICPVCGKGFKMYQGLWHHKTVHLDKSFTCETCGSSFKAQKHLLQHQLRHKTDKPFVCDTCGMRFVTNFLLNKHRKKHTQSAVLFCDVCLKSFSTSHHLIVHKRLHTGERPFSCETCGKGFRDQSTCKEHQLTHSLVKAFACEKCPQQFISMKRLRKHMPIHDRREKRFSCEICGNLFLSQNNLTKHQKLHGEKQYPCALCSKTFVSLRDKNLHQVAHTREKLYSCDLCDKKFTRRAYVLKHRRVHTHEKPYACSRCELKFFSPSALARHMKRHIDKDQASANNIVRQAAMKTKAQKKTYTCSICSKQLRSMSAMKEHAKKFHPNASEVMAIVS